MGLNFSHCDARWSYGGFARFRHKLAATIGVDLDRMEGFGSHLNAAAKNLKPISWATVNDPIVPFLNHSDCDGVLTVEECKQIAPRLKQLVSFWPKNDYDTENALELVEGMELAIKENEELEFC